VLDLLPDSEARDHSAELVAPVLDGRVDGRDGLHAIGKLLGHGLHFGMRVDPHTETNCMGIATVNPVVAQAWESPT